MSHATGYARLTRPQARAALAIAILSLGFAVAVTLSPLASSNLVPDRRSTDDVALYRAEVDRIRQGEGYYQAAAAELTARGYPTRSIFNWRMPLPMWLLGKMPALELGRAMLGALALSLMFAAFEALAREEKAIASRSAAAGTAACGEIGPTYRRPLNRCCTTSSLRILTLARPVGCVLLLTGPLLFTFLDDLFVMPVLWAGVLIALSACAYGVNRPWLGVALGLAALWVRELAVPYCLLCAVIAWRQRRSSELAAWTLGLLGWLVFFGLHCWQVLGLIAPDARAHAKGWIQFGGAGFVISTAQMNAYLLLLPQWVTAIYLVAAMVGLAGWNTPLGMRIGLATCLFVMLFAVVGQSFNQYWGSLIAPLLCFGVVQFPASLRDLCRAATADVAIAES